MHLTDTLPRLQSLAEQALSLWDIPRKATVRLINVAENTTYLVEAPGYRSVLRMHRTRYHSRRAIECELAWLDALRAQAVLPVPGYYVGRDGQAVQQAQLAEMAEPRFLVLFEFVEGAAPDESGDLTAGFEELGGLAARCHQHVMQWTRPEPFERLTWDAEAVFGATPTWGNWRDAPEVDAAVRAVLEDVETTVCARLAQYGKAPDRYNLIHADMRLANLLVDGEQTRVIDFDDCGMGWFMYDFAAAISFIEDDPRVPDWRAAWLRGYRQVRSLTPQDIAEIDTFVMLRRMALLAWIGSHMDAPEPQALAPGFAATTARLGADYLRKMGGS